jgi:hypothetical protein
MGTIPQRIAGIRWRILLPAMMTTLSTYLMLVAKREQYMLRGMGTGWEAPARVLNSLINGPGFLLGGVIRIPIPHALKENLSFDSDRILGIALFWFLIGLSIERRLSRKALDLHRPIKAGVLFTFAALICGFFGFGWLADALCPGVNVTCNPGTMWRELRFVAEHPLQMTTTMELSAALWLLALCAYFVRRAFTAARRSLVAKT